MDSSEKYLPWLLQKSCKNMTILQYSYMPLLLFLNPKYTGTNEWLSNQGLND